MLPTKLGTDCSTKGVTADLDEPGLISQWQLGAFGPHTALAVSVPRLSLSSLQTDPNSHHLDQPAGHMPVVSANHLMGGQTHQNGTRLILQPLGSSLRVI